ncbi:MAG TPA: hypothetical protein VHW00_06900 [Thermoanaerobaculia bacterium]|nr:hypothetical protein [Thermoanaerobaculia bacterium]
MSEPTAPTSSKTPLPPHLRLRFWPFLIALDLLLRWMTIGFANMGYVGAGWTWGAQIVAIPLLVAFAAFIQDARLRKKHQLQSDVDLTPEFTALPAFMVFVALTIGATQIYVYTEGVPWRWLRIAVTVLVTIGYLLYLFFVYIASPRLIQVPLPRPTAESECDANDRVIIDLDAQRASLQQRVDTYTLESALFGALAFSSFVTIAASEKVNLDGTRAFVQDVVRLFEATVALSGDSAMAIAQEIAKETPLLAAIAAQTLVCSAFFLSVIICRLRFNDLLARTDYCIRLAMQFNAKEDDLQNAALQLETVPQALTLRLAELRTNISDAVVVARKAMKGLRPVVTYMALFRGLGVMVFLSILITSSIWIAPALAVVFGGLTVTAYFYPMVDGWLRDASLRHALHVLGADRLLRVRRG